MSCVQQMQSIMVSFHGQKISGSNSSLRMLETHKGARGLYHTATILGLTLYIQIQIQYMTPSPRERHREAGKKVPKMEHR